MLVTDVDETLDGDENGLRSLAGNVGPALLVPNSSRPRENVRKTLAQFPRNLEIAGLITALGTEILLDGREVTAWRRRFAGWDRRPLDELMHAEGIALHPPEMQTPFKASYAVPRERRAEIEAKARSRLPGTRILFSGESDFDAIPEPAGKDRATLFVAERLGVPRERLVVAGDSGNDLAMFRASEMSIAVGNSRRELLDHLDPARSYVARASHAAGILEGLRHWGAIRQSETHHA